ncbi:hypothetical protein D3C81_1759890 [compost metagenome]
MPKMVSREDWAISVSCGSNFRTICIITVVISSVKKPNQTALRASERPYFSLSKSLVIYSVTYMVLPSVITIPSGISIVLAT